MSKFLLAILLVISTFAVVAHGILVYQLNTIESMIVEEETSDTKTVSKEGKDFSKEHLPLIIGFYRYTLLKNPNQSSLDYSYTFSKGYYDKPYNPPKAS